MDALHLLLYQFHQTPPAAFVGFRTVYSQAMNALHLLLYQFHQTPPAAFVGFRTVYSQAMDALHLLLYQFHQTPPAAFVGFRTVYSQAMDALHLLLYQIHQTPPAAFVGFRTVYSQAMDALHLLLYQIHQTPPAPLTCLVQSPSKSNKCFYWSSNGLGWLGLCGSVHTDGCWCIVLSGHRAIEAVLPTSSMLHLQYFFSSFFTQNWNIDIFNLRKLILIFKNDAFLIKNTRMYCGSFHKFIWAYNYC